MVALPRPIVIALLAGLLAGPALADFKRDYANGLKALEDQDYPRAVAELESAVADNPKSVARMRIYGMRFEPYLPHYYLGEARFRAGDCAGALSAWEEAERQQVITSRPEYAKLQESQARCASATVDVSAIANVARAALGDLGDAVDRLTGLKANRLLAADWRASTQWETALADGAAIRERLESELSQAEGAGDAAGIERITAAAGEAERELRALLQTVGARLTALERAQQNERVARARNQAQVEMIQAIAAARSALSEEVSDAETRRLGAELLALTDEGDGLGAGSDAQRYRGLTRSINGKLREYRQALQDYRNRQLDVARRTPPPELMEAAEAYFAGRYEETTRRLANPSQFSDPRVQVQAHLFRAAARYNLYVLAGEDDSRMLREAADDVRWIKRLTGGYAPYLAAFPPKFMNFYEATL